MEHITTTATTTTEPNSLVDSQDIQNTPQPVEPQESKSEPPLKAKSISPSQKSGSPLKRVLSHRRYRTLKRVFNVREFHENDLKYFYAAYRQNGGEKTSDYDEYFVKTTMDANMLYVVTEAYNGEERPLMMAKLTGAGICYEVKTVWMPWASYRDIVTASLTFILALKDTYTMIFIVVDGATLMHHMGRYGVARKVGYIQKYKPNLDVPVWQSRVR